MAVDGEKMKVSDIIRKLNKLGGENGVGILGHRREPAHRHEGSWHLRNAGRHNPLFAHEQLEMLTLDKETLHMKEKLAVDYADLIYNGKWYSPLQEALTAFAKQVQRVRTGTVRIKLYKGNMINAGVWSPYSLYSEEIATFGESDYNQADAAGFIQLYGLPIAVQAKVDGKGSCKHTKGFFWVEVIDAKWDSCISSELYNGIPSVICFVQMIFSGKTEKI